MDARPAVRHDATRALPVLLVRIGARGVGLRPQQVVEVLSVSSWTPIPCEDPANLGVLQHRGRLLAVVDPLRRFAVGRAQPPAPLTCVVVRTRDGEAGLVVNEVLGFGAASAGDKIVDVERLVMGDGDEGLGG